MTRGLNEVEQDFVAFIVERTGRPPQEVERRFVGLRERYHFETAAYMSLSADVVRLYRLLYDTRTDAEAVRSYHRHALLHLYRHISNTYPKPKSAYWSDLKRALRNRQWRRLWHFVRARLPRAGTETGGWDRTPVQAAAGLTQHVERTCRVVDYGAGLGYISFEIARRRPEAQVTLVDVDALVLEFARFRFEKNGFSVQTVPITPDQVYPPLPEHDICIAREVLEHVHEPTRVVENILRSLRPGGILYGHFEDHEPNIWHVSPDLRSAREVIKRHCESIGHGLYRKLR
ncbi:MAG TPA: class I SAM-dependent methyltransferase [Halothiobacillaceae bacterium]|nr:class I SAM-dependent methyltransferase [Halothiobacillaceae bacterium]